VLSTVDFLVGGRLSACAPHGLYLWGGFKEPKGGYREPKGDNVYTYNVINIYIRTYVKDNA